MADKGQSSRLTSQHKASHGAVGIFDEQAQLHDHEVEDTSHSVLHALEHEYPYLQFRWRKDLSKQEINDALKRVDDYLGQTLYIQNARIKPDGGLIEVLDDDGLWRVVVVSEAKFQGKDIDNIRAGVLVGKKHDQEIMVAGNAIERAHKNVAEIANYMLSEAYFPYILFLAGSNFLTHDITLTRPDGSQITLQYNLGSLNRLDRLTAANYGMPINTNLCKNRFVLSNGRSIMLQAASIYTQGDGEPWKDEDMIAVMLDVAHTSLNMLGKDLFKQLTKHSV